MAGVSESGYTRHFCMGGDEYLKSYGMFPWVGNKTWCVDFLLSLMPENIHTMVEVFGGSAAFTMYVKTVQRMMSQMRQVTNFVVNDRNDDIVNFYHCVRDKPFQLMLMCRDYPINSKMEVELFKKAAYPKTLEDLEESRRLHRFIYVALKGIDLEAETEAAQLLLAPTLAEKMQELLYQKAELGDCARAAAFLRSLVYSFRSMGTNYAPRMRTMDRFVDDIANRLSFYMSGVVIYNEDFRSIFARHAAAENLLFCDPPYLGTEKMYRYSEEQPGFFWEDHVALMELSRDTESRVIVTYNDDPAVRELYEHPRFHIVAASHHNSLSATAGTDMQEIFICNYMPPKHSMVLCEQMTLFGGDDANGLEA